MIRQRVTAARGGLAALAFVPGLLAALPSSTTAQSTAALAMASASTERFDVDGIKVIYRHTNTNLFVANLYLLGGVGLATPTTAGLEPMLLEVTERGTRKYPGESLRRAMARTGSEIGVAAHEDFTVLGLRTTSDRVDSTWSIFADRILQPSLTRADFEFVRENRALGVLQRDESPDALLEYLADSVAFVTHPYALSAVGTARSLQAITHEQLREFHRTQMVKSRMLLVIVGNIPRPRIEALVRNTLGSLPSGTYQWKVPEPLGERAGSNVHIVSLRLPTNYILGTWSGPPAGHEDAPALRIASAILSGRLFAEVRSRRNLTYAVEARFRDRALTSGGLYVTTTRPDETLAIMRDELRKLRTTTLRTEDLGSLVQQFLTEYFLDNETTGAQADFLARAELYRGDFRAGERFVSELRNVTGEDVRRAADRWMKDLRWAYLGNPSQVDRFRLMAF
jgi:zinc protease